MLISITVSRTPNKDKQCPLPLQKEKAQKTVLVLLTYHRWSMYLRLTSCERHPIRFNSTIFWRFKLVNGKKMHVREVVRWERGDKKNLQKLLHIISTLRKLNNLIKAEEDWRISNKNDREKWKGDYFPWLSTITSVYWQLHTLMASQGSVVSFAPLVSSSLQTLRSSSESDIPAASPGLYCLCLHSRYSKLYSTCWQSNKNVDVCCRHILCLHLIRSNLFIKSRYW